VRREKYTDFSYLVTICTGSWAATSAMDLLSRLVFVAFSALSHFGHSRSLAKVPTQSGTEEKFMTMYHQDRAAINNL
jgi:hypothetical protein